MATQCTCPCGRIARYGVGVGPVMHALTLIRTYDTPNSLELRDRPCSSRYTRTFPEKGYVRCMEGINPEADKAPWPRQAACGAQAALRGR